jgi:hypothetical protein
MRACEGVAQTLERVVQSGFALIFGRDRVRDHESPSGFEHAGHLANLSLRLREVMDRQPTDDDIELSVFEGHVCGFAQDKAHVAHALTVSDLAGLGEHPRRDVYPDDLTGLRSQGEAHQPRPARHVEHAVVRTYLGKLSDSIKQGALLRRELAAEPSLAWRSNSSWTSSWGITVEYTEQARVSSLDKSRLF